MSGMQSFTLLSLLINWKSSKYTYNSTYQELVEKSVQHMINMASVVSLCL